MEHLFIVRAEAADRFTAQAVGIPELQAVAVTEAEAVEQLSRSLADWWASAKLVRVKIPVAGDSNPWLETFGRSAEDPDFDEFLDLVEQARSPSTHG